MTKSQSTHPLLKLPHNFRNEEKEFARLGLNTWEEVVRLTSNEINDLTQTSQCSYLNLRRLICLGLLICKMNISQKESSLLIHSGLASVKAIATSTPQEIIKRTGRLERMLNIRRTPIISLGKASSLIKKAIAIEK